MALVEFCGAPHNRGTSSASGLDNNSPKKAAGDTQTRIIAGWDFGSEFAAAELIAVIRSP